MIKTRNATKRALWFSFVSMFLCFTMLLGATYAWFTDSVASDINTIVAGNLDIELYHTNKTVSSQKVVSDTKLFTEVEKWEPGVMVWEKFTVKNEGDLALKYELALNVANATVIGDVSFADLLKVVVIYDEDFEYTRENVAAIPATRWRSLESFTEPGNLVAGAESVYGIVIYWMPSNNDNTFNMNNGQEEGSVKVDVGVKLFATQMESEFDSFGSDYDANAEFPAIPVTVRDSFTFTPSVDEPTVTNDGFKAPALNDLVYEDQSITDPVSGDLTTSVELIESSITPNSFTFEINVKDTNGNNVKGKDDSSVFVVPVEIGKGLSSLKISHEDTVMTAVYSVDDLANDTYYYDVNSGMVEIATAKFSPFKFDFVLAPAAEVKLLDDLTVNVMGASEPITLDCGYQFLATQTQEEAIAGGYANWHADFVIYVDKDVAEVGEAGLAGYYSAWCSLIDHKWVALDMSGIELVANEKLRLVESMGVTVSYEEICKYSFDEENLIDGFLCGAYADETMDGVTLTVELRIYETYPMGECPDDHGHISANCETGKYLTLGTYSYTFDNK